MVDMKLGTLVAEIVVNGGYRPHYGTRDAVDGKVILEYKPYSTLLKPSKSTSHQTANLFIPLQLEIFLRGKTKLIVKQERDMPVDHGGPLFFLSEKIFDGSFSSVPNEKHEFPFTINFPETVAGGGSLPPPPPSFSHAFAQFPDTVDLKVLYRLGVKLSIPGIEIKTIVPEHSKQPEIFYDLPRPIEMNLNSTIASLKQKSVVQTYMLLPPDQRPQGFQQRVRSVFGTAPVLGCEICCSNVQHIWAGHRPRFTVGIRRSEGGDASLAFPEVAVSSFRAELIAYTWCDASKRLKGPFERIDSRTVQKLEARTALPLALTKATDYSALLTTDEVDRWPSSFKHALLVRRYFIKVKLKMKVAQQSVSFVREFEVRMVPRPKDLENGSAGEAGPSNGVLMPPPPYSGSELEPYRE